MAPPIVPRPTTPTTPTAPAALTATRRQRRVGVGLQVQAEQPRGVAPGDLLALVVVEPGALQLLVEGAAGHVERVVGAERHPRRADLADQEGERPGRVGD